MVDKIGECLREVVSEVPFNNFGRILEANGEDVPPEIGGNCVHQSKILVDKLRSLGIEASYLKVDVGTHVAVLAKLDGEEFYCDPFLAQSGPLSITKAFSDRAKQTVDGIDVDRGIKSQSSLEVTGRDNFRVYLSKMGYRTDSVFSYLRDEVAQSVEDLKGAEIIRQSSRFRMVRVLGEMGSFCQLSLGANPLRGVGFYVDMDGVNIRQDDNPERFEALLGKFSDRIKLPGDKLLALLERSKELAPMGYWV